MFSEKRDTTQLCLCANVQTLTKVLLGGPWRGQWRRGGVVVHTGGHADTPTQPAAPGLTRRTRPVGYWTPSTERERFKIDTRDVA